MPGACVRRARPHEGAGVVQRAREVQPEGAATTRWQYLVEWDVGSSTWCTPDEIEMGTLPAEDRKRSTDALDHEDLMLVLHVIDFALEHDRLARQNFGRDAALTTESRIGINSLRAKIRAALDTGSTP